jgi:SAM-dependent methyltransferase
LGVRAQTRDSKERIAEAVIWHDVECGAYAADLPLWEGLADQTSGPILELGCGTGRVALHLARRGHEVTGLDSDRALVAAFNDRAGVEELSARAEQGDARNISLRQRFGLVIAPMVFIHLLEGPAARESCLRSVASHLHRDGMAAFALFEGDATGTPASPPLPDVSEQDGWIYSSLPLEILAEDNSLLVERLRQTVSPAGTLRDEVSSVRLNVLAADDFETEAKACDLRAVGRRRIAATERYLESTVVLLEA